VISNRINYLISVSVQLSPPLSLSLALCLYEFVWLPMYMCVCDYVCCFRFASFDFDSNCFRLPRVQLTLPRPSTLPSPISMRKLPELQENFIPNGQIIIRANQTKSSQTNRNPWAKIKQISRRWSSNENQRQAAPWSLRLDTTEFRNKILAQSACENLYVCA